jgi:hypothetical protein
LVGEGVGGGVIAWVLVVILVLEPRALHILYPDLPSQPTQVFDSKSGSLFPGFLFSLSSYKHISEWMEINFVLLLFAGPAHPNPCPYS